MGGWRRAFCTTIPKDTEKLHQHQQSFADQIPSPNPSPRSCAKFGFLSSGGSSNPSTPRLRCKTKSNNNAANSSNDIPLISPNLHCKTTSNTPKSSKKSPKPRFGSNPSSPRSPFSILKNSLRLTKNSCGVCMQSVKTGQGMAIYTAECSHTFHFPCIATHVKKQSTLFCPVCNSSWKDVPLLAIHKLQQNHQETQQKDIMVDTIKSQPQSFLLPTLKTKQEITPNIAKNMMDSRAYNDDEPLVSPPKFIAIPEANEDQEVEEFQGFFVNPVQSDDFVGGYPIKDLRNVEVSILPEAAVVATAAVERTHETFAFVLKVKAPPPPPPALAAHNSNSGHFKEDPAHRAPIDLVTVLDVSGSMSGAKLHMLKRAMRLVISSLGSADRLSIVAFSASPKRLLPLRRMNHHGQRSARRIIDRLACSQGTSAGEALKKATKILDDRRERNPVASIMLLSDGQDEKVPQSNGDNHRLRSSHVSSTRFAHIEIPVHSSGFGQKAGYSREPAEDAFSKCVGGLLSVVVQDLRIQLGFSSGSDPAEITAVYSCNGRPVALGSDCIRLGDLYAEEEKELLVEMRVPSSAFGSHHVLSVRCIHKDPSTQEVVYGREQALLVPRPQAVRSSLPRIERLRNLFITTRAIAESRRLIEHNELTSAMHLLSSARALLLQSRCESADEFVRGLEAELAEVQWRKQYDQQQQQQQQMIQRRKVNEREVGLFLDENGEPLTPTSAWRAAEKLANVATMKKSFNRVSDLHGFENARF
ncbi:hypothetical protein ACH5RR_034833 [Cinchona calisaya]|uniref:Zinc finger family protein n=1 Tax=Cinchona calisaya TaxID=153742 RepID=A0ABD2YGI1_9GENT